MLGAIRQLKSCLRSFLSWGSADFKLMTLIAPEYNFCRVHKTIRVTLAMEARLTDHVWG
jgi:hypothetical protein